MLPSDRKRLVEENMGLVGRVIRDKVRNVHGIGIYSYEDLFQVGCIGLCNAADSYKPGTGNFSTFAYIVIRNEIMDALEYATLRRTRETASDPSDLTVKLEQEYPDGTLQTLHRALDDARRHTNGVTAKGIEAIRLLAQGYTHREIGSLMGGASANNVSAWVARARKYLRSQSYINNWGDSV